jgi:hypothetical protein
MPFWIEGELLWQAGGDKSRRIRVCEEDWTFCEEEWTFVGGLGFACVRSGEKFVFGDAN